MQTAGNGVNKSCRGLKHTRGRHKGRMTSGWKEAGRNEESKPYNPARSSCAVVAAVLGIPARKSRHGKRTHAKVSP